MSAGLDIAHRSVGRAAGVSGPGRADAGWRLRYAAVAVLADALAAVAGSSLAAAATVGIGAHVSDAPGLGYLHLIGAAAPVWIAVLGVSRAYELRTIGVSTEEYRRIANGGVRFLALISVIAFASRASVSRGFVLLSVPLLVIATLALRHGMRVWLHRQRLKGRFVKRVVVVGTAATSVDLAMHLRRSQVAEMDVLGMCVPLTETREGLPVPILGPPDEVWSAAMAAGADTIAIADAVALPVRSVRELAWELEGHNIDVLVVPAVTDIAGPRISYQQVAGLPLIRLDEPRLGLIDRALKGAFDRTIALLGLVVLAPALVTVGLLVRLTSPGPAIFRQERVGSQGRSFSICKFRTMVADAEARLEEVRHLNQHDGLLFKLRDDPRITPVGRHLRAWSIDELPQLWNVVRGQMSLVGPRPPLPSEVLQYDVRTRRRLLMKPGLTGLWQVSGRSDLTWEEGLRLDLDYIDRWSLWTDAVIVAKTVKAVVVRRGAF